MEQEKVTEELVRQNGNQAAAVMADYAAQGGDTDTQGVYRIHALMKLGSVGQDNVVFTVDAPDGRHFTKSYSLTLPYIPGVTEQITWTQMLFEEDLLREALSNPSVFTVDILEPMQGSQTIVTRGPGTYNGLMFINFGSASGNMLPNTYYLLTATFISPTLIISIEFHSIIDRFLSQQTGFQLYDQNGTTGDKCIYGEKICEYTEDGIIPVDETVDGGDTTMSRKLGLNVYNSVIGQLLNMYHNTIIGQLGGGGGGGE